MGEVCATGDVETTLNYALPNPNGSGLFHGLEPTTSRVLFNYIPDPRTVVVKNLRSHESDFSLDANGFEYMTVKLDNRLVEEGQIETKYYEEVRRIVKQRTGATLVYVVGHKIRTSHTIDPHAVANRDPATTPLRSVHVDTTAESVVNDVRKYLGSDTNQLLQNRVRYINVWRPIGSIVHHEPLALADWQTASEESNLLSLRTCHTRSFADVLLGRFSRSHQWYYLEHQTPDEIALFKCYDSRADGGAKFCLHSAFSTDGCYRDAPRRRSIEVNTLVFG